ncbi:MAG: hypothetical protein HOO86_05300 [Bacteroidales bacterium]|nr:hypothetical protein [Bacteroidales bacterium]
MVVWSILLYSSWGITILGLLALPFIPIRFKANFAVFILFANALLTSVLVLPSLSGEALSFVFYAGSFVKEVPVKIDSLAAWFVLIINFTSVTGIIYGSGYMKPYTDSKAKLSLHWILYILFHLSMIWVCLLQNGFAFLIAWEAMSLTSMLLVIFDHNNTNTIKAGINYLVQMHLSIVFLTIGFVWVYFVTGSFGFEAIHEFFLKQTNIWLFLIFFVGFGFKAGFVPFHSWLPHAHPAAPSHVSGVMSGVIVKLGIYGIIRMISFLHADFVLLGEIIITVSVLTGLYGIINAAVHRDFKKMLAYCTIENIGIIGIGLGIGLIGMGTNSILLFYLGFAGALLHVLNHSLFKSLLFYTAGSVYQQTHTRDMEKLGGLLKKMPKTAFLFLIGAIAIGGLPPFNGFISEFVIYGGLVEGMKLQSISLISLLILTFAGLSLIGGLSILTFTKTFGTIFLGSEREHHHQEPKEVSMIMLLPQYLIIAMMLSVAVFPQWYLEITGKISYNLISSSNLFTSAFEPSILVAYSETMSSISLYSLIFVGLIGLFWLVRMAATKGKNRVYDETWGCGYQAPNSRMQYSGKSFSKPLGKMFNFLLIEKKNYPELTAGEIFPETRKYSSHYVDFFEYYFIDKMNQQILYFINYFKFIQNGRVQSYVMYGIVFILAIFVLTMFNLVK